jgi:hypothetical protein
MNYFRILGLVEKRSALYLATVWAAVTLGCGSGNSPGASGGDGGPDATQRDAGQRDATHTDVTSDSAHEAGLPSAVTLSGTVIDLTGAVVAGATLSSGGATAKSSSTGTFTLAVSQVTARTVMMTQAPGYAPLLSVVKVKPGVTAYQVPVVLDALQEATLLASEGGQIQTFVNGRPVTVALAPGAVGDAGSVHLRVASFDARLGPGTMESVPVDGGTSLQSAGMFYVDVVGDDAGLLSLSDGGISFQFDAGLPSDVMGAGAMFGWSLDPDGGLWSAPQAVGAAGSPTISASQFGFWNGDRAVRTACVTGKVATDMGGCTGNWVRADGPDGLSSFDYTGSDGSFCVDGAQAYFSFIYVGATSEMVEMPASAGACTVPSSCMDIGTITVTGCEESVSKNPCAPESVCGPEVDGGGVFCAALQTDPYNCGKCGHECPFADPLCASGTCVPAPDAGPPSDAGTEASAEAGTCGTLIEASLIPYNQTDAAAPTFSGGAIVAGTYALTSVSGGSCPGAVPTASTMSFTPTSATTGTFITAQSTTGTPGTVFAAPTAGVYTISGSALTPTADCGLIGALPAIPYTATSTEITLSLETLYPGCLAVAVFTLE